jgi:spore coat protein U-like protein
MWRVLAAVGGMALLPVAAWAGNDTDTLTVTATVQSSCGLTGGTMAFGNYTSGQTSALDVTGQISYANCNGTLSFELDAGQSGDINNRVMLSGTNRLNYQLYRTSAHNAVWGIGANAQGLTLLTPLSGTIPVYGRIAGGQTVPAGTYTDLVNITMTF